MTLSHRAEQAAPAEARGLLEELYYRAKPSPHESFWSLLDINTPEAHLAAAMMLVPEGWNVSIFTHLDGAEVRLMDDRVRPVRSPDCAGSAESPALALIAAIARSVE